MSEAAAPAAPASAAPAAPAAAATPTTPAPAAPASTPSAAAPAAAAAAPAAPTYDLKAPEGFDAAHLPKFVEKAKAYGIAPDKAQAWVNDAHAGMIAHQKAMDEALAKQKGEWHAELRADKTIGGEKFDGTIQRAQQIVDKVDAQVAPGIKKILADTGYGDHPAVVRLFAYLGEQGREDTFAPAAGHSAGSQPQTLTQLLYPKPT
jgi:hypothetical protein